MTAIKRITYRQYGAIGESELKTSQGTIYMYVPSSSLHAEWMLGILKLPANEHSENYKRLLVEYVCKHGKYQKSWFDQPNAIAIYGNPNYENPFLATALILESLSRSNTQEIPQGNIDTSNSIEVEPDVVSQETSQECDG